MNWKRIGEIVLDSGHLLVASPAAADVRHDTLWGEVMRLADAGGQMWEDTKGGVLALLPCEGTYAVEVRDDGADFELRVRLLR